MSRRVVTNVPATTVTAPEVTETLETETNGATNMMRATKVTISAIVTGMVVLDTTAETTVTTTIDRVEMTTGAVVGTTNATIADVTTTLVTQKMDVTPVICLHHPLGTSARSRDLRSTAVLITPLQGDMTARLLLIGIASQTMTRAPGTLKRRCLGAATI